MAKVIGSLLGSLVCGWLFVIISSGIMKVDCADHFDELNKLKSWRKVEHYLENIEEDDAMVGDCHVWSHIWWFKETTCDLGKKMTRERFTDPQCYNEHGDMNKGVKKFVDHYAPLRKKSCADAIDECLNNGISGDDKYILNKYRSRLRHGLSREEEKFFIYGARIEACSQLIKLGQNFIPCSGGLPDLSSERIHKWFFVWGKCLSFMNYACKVDYNNHTEQCLRAKDCLEERDPKLPW